MKRNLLCLIVFIVLVARATGVNAAAPCLTEEIGTPWSAIMLALLALNISFDVVAIGYIIGKLFPGTGLTEWVHKEFWEITKSVMVIVAIYSVLAFLGNISSVVAPPEIIMVPSPEVSVGVGVTHVSCSSGIPGLVSCACAYLNNERSFLSTTFSYLSGLSAGLGVLDSMKVGLYVPVPIWTFFAFLFGFMANPYQNTMLASSGAGQYQSILNDTINFIAYPVALLISVQFALLPTIFELGLAVIIPIGLVLRAFPFIREVGGTLIAIGVGMSLIYPAVLVLFNYPVTHALQGNALPVPSYSCNSFWLVCGLGGIVFSVFQGLSGAGVAFQSFGSIYPALGGILYYSSYLILQLLLFILDLVIAIPLVDNIAKMLGGTPPSKISIGKKLKFT